MLSVPLTHTGKAPRGLQSVVGCVVMSKDETIVRFQDVSHEFGPRKPILDEASFSVRRGSKITLMGQNGAGKSTIFKLMTGAMQPEGGEIHKAAKLSIATTHTQARYVIDRGVPGPRKV